MPNVKLNPYILKADKLETQDNKTLVVDKNSTNEQYPSAKAVYDALADGEGVGETTPQGGEIFNDYENNQSIAEFSSAKGSFTFAGTKFFYIIDKDEEKKTYTLKDYYLDISSSGQLAVNDLFSITTGGNREDCGTIKSITQEEGTNNAIVTVSNWYWDSTEDPDPEKPSASFIFRVIDKPMCGTNIMGTAASAEGYSTKALMMGSHSEGDYTVAGGKYAHAEGRETRAGYAAHAEGYITKAMGQGAHSEGHFTDAQGWYSHSEGNNTKSIGQSSHAEGANSVASGQFSHAEGNNNIASGDNSHSEGCNTTASGGASHSEGYSTTASNSYAHAEGANTVASGYISHAEGKNTKASGSQAHAEGSNTLASNYNTHAEGNNTQATKNEAHAEGCNTTASGGASHAEGESTTASGYSSHAEGCKTKAMGQGAHAEGNTNTASGDYSHVEGYDNASSGQSSHSEGNKTKAIGTNSHAEGEGTTASGYSSHAGGLGTIASGSSQTSIGKYNREDDNALLIVGNGSGPSATERSNAFTVNKNGTATVQTNPIEDMDVANKGYVDNLVGSVETALDSIIAMQEELIGGDA